MADGASMPSDPMMGGGMDPMAGGDPNAMGGQNPMAGGDPMMNGGMDPMAGGDPNAMGGQDPMMGNQNNEFDMGIGITPDENPKKYIEGAVAKVASELRKYQQSQPSPDMPLNKTAVNTIAAATKTNLQNGQENELMTSYADTMRNNGDNGDNDNDSNSDNFDLNQNDNTEQDPMNGDMSMDPMAGGDPNAMNNDMNNMNIQETIQKIVKEMYKDRLGNIENKPGDEMKPLNNQHSYMRKPFTPPVKK